MLLHPFRLTLVDRSIDGATPTNGAQHRHAPPPSPSPPPLPPHRQYPTDPTFFNKQVGKQVASFLKFIFLLLVGCCRSRHLVVTKPLPISR